MLHAYSPRLARRWLLEAPDESFRIVDGTLVFVDISGFTALTERLSARGKVGAEQVTDVLDVTFGRLLEAAYGEGADLIKWGGDAMLLLFDGEDHAVRACRAARGMRERLEQRGHTDRRSSHDRRDVATRRRTPDRAHDTGRRDDAARRRSSRRAPDGSQLRMSIGINSGRFTFCLVGDPAEHRELLVLGPDVTRTVAMEATAEAGEIVISGATASLLPTADVAGARGDGFLLGEGPVGTDHHVADEVPDAPLLVPADVRRHLAQAPGESEHRRSAIGFVKFSGTDDLLAAHGPAPLAEELDRLVRAVQEAAAENGVTFLASDLDADGGKFLLAAGAPINRGSVEERMLRTVRRVCDGDFAVTVRAGVNSGAVFAGDFGPPFRRTYTILGDSVNLAARLMAKAGPGEVIASAAALHASRVPFQAAALDPFPVKGKADLVEASIVGAIQEDTDAERADAGPVVGRDAHLQAIADAADRARAGAGSTIAIAGGSGMGLSRLQREAVAQAVLPDHRTAGDAYQQATAYARFRPLLRSILGLPRDARGAHAAELLVEVVRRRAPDLEPWVPLYALVLDVPVASTPEIDALADEFRRDRLEAVTVDLLGRLLDDPCLISVDDVHLLDEASLSLLTAVERATPAHPWVLLLTGRSDEAWHRGLQTATQRLDLAPLTTEESTALVRHLLRERPLPPADVSAIAQRGEGSPAFLVSLVRAALAGESLDQLPDSIEAMVAHQIDALPPTQRTLLRYASVLGMTVRLDELAELASGKAVADALDALPDLGFFLARETSDRYRFTRALIRDTAYEGLPFTVRKRLHARAAAVIESRVEDPMSVCEVLSAHYSRAGVARKAWDYSIEAAKRAESKSAYAEAEVFYQRAVTSARSSRRVSKDDRARVYLHMAEAQDRVGRLGTALTSLLRARSNSTDKVASANIEATAAHIQKRLGNLEASRRRVRLALELLDGQSSSRAAVVRTECLVIACGIAMHQGRSTEAMSLALQARDGAIQSAAPSAQALAEGMINFCNSLMGVADQAQGEIALSLYEGLGDRRHQAEVLNNLALQDWWAGRGQPSLVRYRRAATLALEAGDSFAWASALANVGDVSMRLGHVTQAETDLDDARNAFLALNAESFVASTERSLGLVYAFQGRTDRAMHLTQQAIRTQERLGEADEVSEGQIALATVHLLTGNPDAARTWSGVALERVSETTAPYLLPQALRVHGAALSDLGELHGAKTALTRAWSTSDASVPERGFIAAELALLAERTQERAIGDTWHIEANEEWQRLGFTGNSRYPVNA